MSGRDGGPVGRREVAYRLFAAEYDDADLEYSDSGEERAPNYVVTPTGARVNRLFVVGVLTEVEPVSDDVLRARIVDPTGAFVVYAGQYQPDAVAFLTDAEIPSYVAVTGKARTFRPDDGDRVFTSVRPESATAVDAATRDRWTVQSAEHTLARVATMAQAIDREVRGDDLTRALESAGVAPGLAAGIALALDHYGTTKGYLSALREQAVAALEIVGGTRDAVPELELAPGDDGPVATGLSTAPAVAGALTTGRFEDGPAPRTPEPDDAGRSVEDAATSEDEVAESVHDAVSDTADVESSADGSEPPTSTGETATAADPEAGHEDRAELGDFDSGEAVDLAEATEPYEMDQAEREQVEAEFGTEFSPGSEVADPGEADIDPEAGAAETAAPSPDEEPEERASSPGGDAGSAGEATDDETTAPVELEDAVVNTMAQLDDGDGADRTAVIESVAEAHGADPEEVEDAVQEALMSGRCYEPTDGRLKAI